MLIIRAQQLDALGKSASDRFVASEARRLAETTSDPDTCPDEQWVRKGIKTGKGYGMHTESDHARFNDLRVESGPEFPGSEDLEVLERDDLWGWQKLDELQGRRALETQSQVAR